MSYYSRWLSNEVETREFLNISPPFTYMGKRHMCIVQVCGWIDGITHTT